MSDSRHERFASVLVGYCTGVKPGELVTLETTTLAAPIMRDLYRAVLAAGALVVLYEEPEPAAPEAPAGVTMLR